MRKLWKKEAIDIQFSQQKADHENNENNIQFRWSDVQRKDEEEIARLISLRTSKRKLIKNT